MKAKRILCVLMTCLMLTGILAVGASAADANGWTEPEKKTEAAYTIPYIGKYLAWPGEILVTKLLLPKLLGSMKLDLLGDAYKDATVNSALSSVATQLQTKLDGIIESSAGIQAATVLKAALGGGIPAGILYYIFASDAPDKVKNPATLAADITTDVTWGVTDRASFINKMCIVLRPAVAMSYANDIIAKYDTDYAPGLKALGATDLPTSDELKDTLDPVSEKVTAAKLGSALSLYLAPMGMGAAPNIAKLNEIALTADEQAAVDSVTKAVLEPLLAGLDKLSDAAITDLLFKELPNLLYNSAAIDKLLATGFVSELLGGLDFDLDGGFKTLIEGALTDALTGILGDGVQLDIADLLTKITYAGDLKDGIVVADQSVIYNLLVKFLYDAITQEAVTPLLLSLWSGMPNFVSTILYYLIKGTLWVLYL